MELRHLRCFVVLAEELHFTRAAERLHIEQPPLSRAIKELEDELGVLLFDRDRRGTRLTAAGTAFLQDTRRLFTVLEQARENAKAIAAGSRGSLRIAVSDGAIDPWLPDFLASCRAEEPDIEIRLCEVPLAEQLRGLRAGDFTIGFAHTAEVGDDIVAEPIWQDPLVIAVPVRHELLVHKAVPLHELGGHPLVLCDPQVCEGYCRELARLLRLLEREPNVVEHVSSLEMMLTLVSAGFGVGFTTATRVAISPRPDVLTRPLAVESAVITTYLLRLGGGDAPASLERFIVRLRDLVRLRDSLGS
ncbi:LysR family transcriptional regulator [Pseudomonas sp. X10]